MTGRTKIGKYEIRRQIGRGAMGVVYEAFDPVIERRVAIKTLRLELFEPSQIGDVRTRFKREAQSAGQLAHPHIVTVYDYGDYESTPYIVMEFLTGNELSQILGRGARLPLSEVVRLMTQLLGALTYAHERKVVHRDVKPGNIFILDDGSLKVVDFGLAHVEASNLTDTGALLGTPAYMSPEQFLALPIDERSDIFSAGVILYELLTGDKPFTGSVTTIMQKVLRQDPIEPSVLNPTISTAWDTVIKRAMAKKPDARFQSARQFSETIKQVFEKSALNVSVEVTLTGDKAADLGGETLRPSLGKQQVPKAQRPVSPESSGPEIAPVKSSSKKGLAIAAIAAIAVVVVTGAATFYMSQRPRDDLAKQELVSTTVQKDDGAAERAAVERAAANKAAANAKAAADNAATDAKEAAEKVAQETKIAQERSAQKKAAEAKKAAEKAQAEKIVAEKAEKAAEKEVKEKSASEVARLEKVRAEKVEAERIAAEKAAAEKVAANRATVEKDIAEKAKKDGRSAGDANRTGEEFNRKQMYAQAVAEYRIAAAMGFAIGQSNLAAMYRLGRGVAQDYSEANRWYRRAAEQNNASAQNGLGDSYRNGWGVTQDHAEAVRWYRKSADQNNRFAQSNIGFMYMNGMGVAQDDAEAVRWYRKSAEQNFAMGLNNLGFMYERGRGGVPKDLEEAKKLYRKAAEQGSEPAKTALQRLGN